MKSFYSTRLKRKMLQINKVAARKLFDKGHKIFMLPSNISFDNMWITPCPVEKPKMWCGDFNAMCNDFAYYNCNNETGNYIHFFIEVI